MRGTSSKSAHLIMYMITWLSHDYHVISHRRVVGLLESTKGTVVCGGEHDEATCYIAPTVIVDVTPDEKIMQVGSSPF